MSEEAIELNLNLKKLIKVVSHLCDHIENLRSTIEDLSASLADQEDEQQDAHLIDEEVIDAKRKRGYNGGH